MGLSNDERGWVMTCLSGIACVVGASIICVDIIIRQFPGKKDFRIQDSDTFLSLSLSLSFGVMLFSALYSMLPSAKKSLMSGGFSSQEAAWILVACFIGGVVGIQVISRVMHHFIPSHVVDCEHSHEEEASKQDGNAHDHDHEHEHEHDHEANSTPPRRPIARGRSSLPGHLHQPQAPTSRQSSYIGSKPSGDPEANLENGLQQHGVSRRPSLQQRLSQRISSLTTGKKSKCDTDGPCYGYSELCGQECFKNISARGGSRAPVRTASAHSRPAMSKHATAQSLMPVSEATPLLHDIHEEPHAPNTEQNQNHSTHTTGDERDDESMLSSSEHQGDHHHHHVPTNAFLSIGLQTSIAIALHKLPEGFITYATNHANPKLGFSVFLALFIHNITEGFAMALPLYLAINSRVKAMAWSFVLGGLSQPIGAAVAALWFHLAGKGEWAPSEGVYGGMFAVTAGIMASVALQLFSESLELTHSRNLCMIGAFTGMTILGISSALTA